MLSTQGLELLLPYLSLSSTKRRPIFPLWIFAAVPRVSKLPVFMQALFRAHREHPRSTQAHQGEETQEKHHG